jgi:hypothetical protein
MTSAESTEYLVSVTVVVPNSVSCMDNFNYATAIFGWIMSYVTELCNGRETALIMKYLIDLRFVIRCLLRNHFTYNQLEFAATELLPKVSLEASGGPKASP